MYFKAFFFYLSHFRDPDYFINRPSTASFPDFISSDLSNTDCDECPGHEQTHRLVLYPEEGIHRITVFGYGHGLTTGTISLELGELRDGDRPALDMDAGSQRQPDTPLTEEREKEQPPSWTNAQEHIVFGALAAFALMGMCSVCYCLRWHRKRKQSRFSRLAAEEELEMVLSPMDEAEESEHSFFSSSESSGMSVKAADESRVNDDESHSLDSDIE